MKERHDDNLFYISSLQLEFSHDVFVADSLICLKSSNSHSDVFVRDVVRGLEYPLSLVQKHPLQDVMTCF